MRVFERSYWLLGLAIALSASNVLAQGTGQDSGVLSLKQAFEAAWARQPEAQALSVRRDAAAARRQVAESWSAEPPSLELSGRTDSFNRGSGGREYEIGLAVPLWLPGERPRAQALAAAEYSAVETRTAAAQLRVAEAVRGAFWSWQRSRIELDVAKLRLANAQRFATDVAARVKAGDLSRADQHQADGAVAAAVAAFADSQAFAAQAAQRLRALTGGPVPVSATVIPEIAPGEGFEELDARHPALLALADRAEIAREAQGLAGVQRRANPELTLATTLERGGFGEAYAQTVTVGVRIPFGSDSRSRARVAGASAERIEAEAQLEVERERVAADIELARARMDAMRAQLAAAEQRATLARETRGFFEQAFRLGETDLPTRLRVELEASEAERQAARARIDVAETTSQLRQALGLLPE